MLIHMRIYAITQGQWGRRFIENIMKYNPANWKIREYFYDTPLPTVIDEPNEFIPVETPENDLFLYLGENPSLASIIPDIAQAIKAKSVIAPIDNVSWLPFGLAHQIQEELTELNIKSVFPVTFCALKPMGDPYIDKFANCYGWPKLQVKKSKLTIQEVNVIRGAPCGSTHYAAKHITGKNIDGATEQIGIAFHGYPCLASTALLRQLNNDSLMHKAGYRLMDELKKALIQSETEQTI